MALLDPALTIGGVPLYQMGGQINGGIPVYRPEYGGAGLLNDGKDFQDVRNNFAGGILNGFQYNPSAGMGQSMFSPIAPSGMFTQDESQGVQVKDNRNSGGGLTFRDALGLKYGPPGTQQGVPMPPALFEALGSENASGRFKDLFGFEFDPDDEFDPSNENYKKLSGMLEDPYYWDQSR